MVGGRNESMGDAGTSPSKIILYIRRSLARLSPTSFACLVLVYLTALHAIGLYHFTRGFLLTRLTLDTRSPSYAEDDPVHGLARWDKAIVLVIDALRTDFLITPHDRVDEYYHDVLTLPAQLTAQDPTRSVLYNAYSDPPTTTMQRIKGFTTGSLPTFIDAGANFASSAIEEDSLVHQLHAHERKLAFMGDETWTLLFPRLFEPGMSHPFDSFNVEDLHTVDTGVIEHLFPYLDRANSSRWDVMIGHFLGVDHVGHRVGPSSSIMTDKLAQMNDVLTRVVDEMDDDTLLVVLGDHGMDSRGDHGGDGTAETASALWMYSKSRPIVPLADRTIKYHTTGLLGDDTQQVRTVNQIDLVPTLALALGVPIPFNNIGKVIPEFFRSADDDDLTLAMARNTEQVKRYLDSYTGQLDRRALNASYAAITTASTSSDGTGTAQVFLDETLAHLRQLWAQFSVPRISLGLFILFLTLPTTLILYTAVRNTRRAADSAWQPLMREILALTFSLGLVGGCIIGTVRGAYTRVPSEAIAWSVTGAAVVSQVTLLTSLGGRTASSIVRSVSASSSRLTTMAGAGMLLLHAGSYAANSFIIWEDRATLFLACSLAALPMLKALTAPTPRLRLKIFGFSVATAVIVRIIGMSTVCREEQQPYCTVTFYAHLTQPVAPTSVLALTLPVAWYLPNIIGLFLAQSRALSGPAKPALIPALRAALTAGAAYWNLEWAETWTGIQPARRPMIAFIKLWLARVLLGVLSGAAPYVWAQLPLCIDVKREVVAEDQAEVLLAAPSTAAAAAAAPPLTTEQPPEPETRVIVYGFANSYGASYLLFLCIPFAILFLLSQPTAQLVLAAALVGILCHLESVDAQRDAKSMALAFSGSSAPGEFDGGAAAVDGTTRTLPPRFTELAFLALLAHVLFFSTGHQAVLSTIQWKTAFIGVATVVYPVSPLLVAINTFGPFMLVALAVPLLALWNVSPHPSSAARTPVIGDTVQAALGFSLYFSTTAFTSALFSAYLRRHLMVWKVFAPRFMMAGVVLLLVDVALVIGVGFGVARVAWTVKRTFKCESV
ncbi:hypothetical protein QFC22_000325 [Naganishia vaughanmartiniae]|uniref:Uncharacterized protein n=1 Tax=Naganishia vaughanmartiniae TaxID=1424756 RepID=A0ACC2XMS3_9TREE|nr:hypothetical protein QFC22_000325 [Naganishia vaughanmartiniae]